jgi:hypothetical protein
LTCRSSGVSSGDTVGAGGFSSRPGRSTVRENCRTRLDAVDWPALLIQPCSAAYLRTSDQPASDGELVFVSAKQINARTSPFSLQDRQTHAPSTPTVTHARGSLSVRLLPHATHGDHRLRVTSRMPNIAAT